MLGIRLYFYQLIPSRCCLTSSVFRLIESICQVTISLKTMLTVDITSQEDLLDFQEVGVSRIDLNDVLNI